VEGNLAHIVGGQIVWLSRWTTGANPESLEQLESIRGFDAIRQSFAESHAGLREYLASLGEEDARVFPLTDARTAVILPDCERRQAVAFADGVIARLAHATRQDTASRGAPSTTLSVGAATQIAAPKNFDPSRLMESAERCLNAARACNISSVKSIEV